MELTHPSEAEDASPRVSSAWSVTATASVSAIVADYDMLSCATTDPAASMPSMKTKILPFT
jgi:hypothetical protein